MGSDEDLGGMEDLAEESVKAADAALADEELRVIKKTSPNLAKLSPKISDPVSFEKFLAAVDVSTKQNESAAQLKTRLSQLGDGVLSVAREAAALAAKGLV